MDQKKYKAIERALENCGLDAQSARRFYATIDLARKVLTGTELGIQTGLDDLRARHEDLMPPRWAVAGPHQTDHDRFRARVFWKRLPGEVLESRVVMFIARELCLPADRVAVLLSASTTALDTWRNERKAALMSVTDDVAEAAAIEYGARAVKAN